jgi:hypothetical protein
MRLPALSLLVLIAMTGCRPVGVAAPSPHAAYPDPLASSLQVEAMGDSVRFVLQITNATDAPVAVTFPSAQIYDFAVREGTRSVWTWSADRSFVQSVRTITLAVGETRLNSEVWRVPAELRGRTLTAVGRLTSIDHPLERAAEFRLP